MSKKPFNEVSTLEGIEGKVVLVRSSLNVPIVDGEILNQFRITRGLATINLLRHKGAKVLLVGHIGSDGEQSTAPIATLLVNKELPATHIDAVSGVVVKNKVDTLSAGDILVLENVRRDPREKQNDKEFAQELADLADIYVNDAFAASHREHASLCAITQFLPSFVGLNFVHEYEELLKMRSPQSPALFMLGGAKFDTKIPLVEALLEVYDHMFIGGALANDFYKAKGLEVGTSLVSEVDLSSSPLVNHPKILLPVDVVVSDGTVSRTIAPDQVQPTEKILDCGPKTVSMLEPLIKNAKSILWNGPFGNYEAGYAEQTLATAVLVADATGCAVVGGGDTVASIEELCIQEKFAFLSTAGGAMLTFLEIGTLPAIEALRNAPEL